MTLGLVLAMTLLAALLVLIIWILRPKSRSKRLVIPIAFFTVLLTFAGLFIAMLGPLSCSRGIFAEFRANMEAKVNPEDIQKWAVPIIEGTNPKYPVQPQDITIDGADIPSFLHSVISEAPEMAVVSNAGKPDGSILILWGGGFYHFGLLINQKGHGPTETAALTVTSWKDGIWFVEQNQ